MSAFNPNSIQLRSEEWQDVAVDLCEKTNSQYIIIAGIIGGLFAASATGFPPTGVLIAAWSFQTAWKRNQEANKNEAAILEHGCVAHVLVGDRLRQFRNQVGIEEAIAQISWAKNNGFSCSRDALELLSSNQQFLSLANKDQGSSASPITTSLPVQDRFPVANDQSPIISHQASVTNIITFDQEIPDLARKVAQDLNNSLFIGVPGVGKDFFISNALEWVKKIHPNCTVFFIDPKDDPKETGYFDGRVDQLFRLNICEYSPTEVWDWIQRCLEVYDRFDAGTGLKLLVINELAATNRTLTNVKGALNWLVSKMIGYSSSGDSRGIKIWGVSQNAHNSGIGFDGGSKSIFTPYVIVSESQLSASEQVLKAQIIPSDKKLASDELMDLCRKSPVRRAIFHGGLNRWFPMPMLRNFSGYNRDERKFVDQADTCVERSRNKPKSQTDLLIKKLESTDKSLDGFIAEELGVTGAKGKKMKQAIDKILQNRSDLVTKFYGRV